MSKIDRRISYRIVLDCETAPMDKELNKVIPQNMLVYDVGFAVVDKRGRVYEKFSFINADVFCGEKELMQSAYYAKKIPSYWEQIKNGESTLTSFYNIRKALIETIEKYNVKEVYAHNMRFDYGALTNTQRWLTKSKYRYYFPKDIIICDTLKMARQVVANTPTYVKFCNDNGYMTKGGQVRLTAEILYRYITRDMEFNEEHKGLDDVMIEKEILAYCFKKHKKMERKLWA